MRSKLFLNEIVVVGTDVVVVTKVVVDVPEFIWEPFPLPPGDP
jgi:hypothetical protein